MVLPSFQILQTRINSLTMDETLAFIERSILANKQIHHVVVNAAKIVAMQKDITLRKSVNECDLINADGQSVVWASRFLGNDIKERVAGIDLMENLVQLSAKKGFKIFLFGAKEEIVLRVKEIYEEAHGKGLIAGYRNGYFKPEEAPEIAKEIADSGAQLLFVAISSPTKENFLYDYREQLSKVNFIMGVGGSFDVVAGLTKRAPIWMQNAGLEWFYRLVQEPGRMWKRYLVGNSKFIWIVLKEKFSGTKK